MGSVLSPAKSPSHVLERGGSKSLFRFGSFEDVRDTPSPRIPM